MILTKNEYKAIHKAIEISIYPNRIWKNLATIIKFAFYIFFLGLLFLDISAEWKVFTIISLITVFVVSDTVKSDQISDAEENDIPVSSLGIKKLKTSLSEQTFKLIKLRQEQAFGHILRLSHLQNLLKETDENLYKSNLESIANQQIHLLK